MAEDRYFVAYDDQVFVAESPQDAAENAVTKMDLELDATLLVVHLDPIQTEYVKRFRIGAHELPVELPKKESRE